MNPIKPTKNIALSWLLRTKCTLIYYKKHFFYIVIYHWPVSFVPIVAYWLHQLRPYVCLQEWTGCCLWSSHNVKLEEHRLGMDSISTPMCFLDLSTSARWERKAQCVEQILYSVTCLCLWHISALNAAALHFGHAHFAEAGKFNAGAVSSSASESTLRSQRTAWNMQRMQWWIYVGILRQVIQYHQFSNLFENSKLALACGNF